MNSKASKVIYDSLSSNRRLRNWSGLGIIAADAATALEGAGLLQSEEKTGYMMLGTDDSDIQAVKVEPQVNDWDRQFPDLPEGALVGNRVWSGEHIDSGSAFEQMTDEDWKNQRGADELTERSWESGRTK